MLFLTEAFSDMYFCILKNTVRMHHQRREPDHKVRAVAHSLISMLREEKENGPQERKLKTFAH